MKKSVLLTVIFLLSLAAKSQNDQLPILTPLIQEFVIVSEQDKKDNDEVNELFRKIYDTKEITEKDLTEQQKKLIERADELEDISNIGGVGCSWYCGGGPHKITASSELTPSKHFSYSAENAHDFDPFTAWIEGKEDYGIGERIEYFFLANDPPVTTIKILNGYVKNINAWKQNSRVKKFKLYVNNKSYAILMLHDTIAFQEFILRDTLQSNTKGKDLVLKFEILEVYPGDKFKDVAITEIEFDGIGVHCFLAGTNILLPNGKTTGIEDIKTGDVILSYNQQTRNIEEAIVLETAQQLHHNLYEFDFQGIKITATDDHPFFYNGVYYSLRANDYYGEITNSLVIGDKVLCNIQGQNKVVTLTSISKLEKCLMTYTITKLDRNKIFFANGLFVATEEFLLPSSITNK